MQEYSSGTSGMVSANQLLLLVDASSRRLSRSFRQSIGRRLVEQQGHGLRLLGLRHEYRVTAQHDRLVLELCRYTQAKTCSRASATQ